MSRERPLPVYCSCLDGNSTAKISVRLANAYVSRGVPTDLLVNDTHKPIPENIDSVVRIIHMCRMGKLARVPRMTLYLHRHRPRAVLTHRIRENLFRQQATLLVGTGTPIFVTMHGLMGVKLQHLKGPKAQRYLEFMLSEKVAGAIDGD